MPDFVSVEGGRLFFLAEGMEDDLFGENAGMEVGFLGKNGEAFMEAFPSPPPPPPPRSGFIGYSFYEQPCNFLYVCFLCKIPLSQGMDIFMYRDTTFCSKECRQEQFNITEGTERNRIPSVRVPSFSPSIYKSKFLIHFLQRVRSILANDVAQLEATIKAPSAQALISLSMLRDSPINLSIYKSKFFHILQRVRSILANDVAQLEATIKAPSAQALIGLSMLRDSPINLSIYKSKFFHFLQRVRSILANDVAQLEATIKAPSAQALIGLSMLRDSPINLSIYKSKFFHILQRVRSILANDVAQLEATIKAPSAQAMISLSMLRDSPINLSIYKSKFFHFLKRVRSILANDVAQLEATIKATAQALNLPMLYFRIFEECSNFMHQMINTWYEIPHMPMTINSLNPCNLEACNFLAD